MTENTSNLPVETSKNVCCYCGATKALTKHSLNGKHKAPFVIACKFCHNVINGASQKSFEILLKRTKRRVKEQQMLLKLLLAKKQSDGSFLIPDALLIQSTEEQKEPTK